MSMLRWMVTAAFLALSANPNAWAAVENEGQVAFNNHCRNCHSYKRADNRLGPSLFGILGAKAGGVGEYRGYSGGLVGFTWDAATLDRFMADPRAVSPGTTMIFPPVDDPAERTRIIEFLKSLPATAE
jgi:cytochrome c